MISAIVGGALTNMMFININSNLNQKKMEDTTSMQTTAPQNDKPTKVLFMEVKPSTAALIANISIFAWIIYIAVRIWGYDPLNYIVDPIRSLFGLGEEEEPATPTA